MATKQQSLIANLGRLADYVLSTNVDFQLAVTSSDVTADAGVIVGSVLTRATPNLKSALLQNVAAVGFAGSESSQLLAATTAAIAPPLNTGLVRPDAVLSVVAVSDSDDQSPGLVSAWVAQWMSVKSSPSRLSFTVVGPIGTPAPGCSYDGDAGAPRSVAAALLTNGQREDICDPDWERSFESLSNDGWGARTNFYLTATPDLSGGNAIAVVLDGAPLNASGADGGTRWRYDVAANSVDFEPLSLPPPGSTLTISYKVACLP